jgi:hypothetical protein
MAVDRYANDGLESRRTVRERYDLPVPKTGADVGGDGDGATGIPEVLLPRSAARAAGRVRAQR